MVDWNNREIGQQQISRSIRTSYLSGGLGILWLVTATPQQILTVFVKNHLGASSTQLGLMVGIINILALLNLASIGFYSLLRGRKKLFFMVSTLIQRCMAFLMAYASFRVAAGGSRSDAIVLVLVAAVLAALSGNISGSGWWTWMADLIPAERRASFFGIRSAVSQFVNIIFFFAATLVLDLYLEQVFVVYGILFLIGGVGGVLDLLLHVGIPEPQPTERERVRMTPGEFFRPLRDKKFRSFCFILGFYLFSLNLAAPFLAPFTTDPAGGGAPNVWLGIGFAISQLTWVIMAPFWGMLMDRMGKKPVVIIGGFLVISWLGYLLLTPRNYALVLPVISFIGGFFAPAFWEGISQFMLALSPDRHRTAYSAWYWTFFGVSAAASPLIGGLLYDYLSANPIRIGALEPSAFHFVLVLSVLLVLFSLTHLGRISVPKDKSVRAVMTTILNPGVFRAVSNIAILSRPTRAQVVQKTLWESRGGALNLSFSEICIRLDDPEAEVREAAAHALARLGSREAVEELLSRLSDPEALSRPALARALGSLRGGPRPEVVEALELALTYPSEEVQAEAAAALGRLGARDSRDRLVEVMRQSPSFKVRIAAAEAAGRLGASGKDFFDLMHATENWKLRRQLAIAIGDSFGNPGEVYHFMTGDQNQNIQSLYRLSDLCRRQLSRSVHRSEGDSGVAKPSRGERRRADEEIERRTLLLAQRAMAEYSRQNYLAAVQAIEELKGMYLGIVAAAHPGIREYWAALDQFVADEGQPRAQDVILDLYALYRSMNPPFARRT